MRNRLIKGASKYWALESIQAGIKVVSLEAVDQERQTPAHDKQRDDAIAGCGPSTLRKAVSCAGEKIACNIDAEQRRRTISDAFIARRTVSCIPISLDQYRRTVATCSVGDIDLGEWLARNGLALDWPQYSRQKYDPAQREAEHAGRGMWAGSYVEPWLYRVCIRAGGSPGNCSDDANAHP